jgi:hypothetical protein
MSGYDPPSLYRILREAHRGARGCIEALEARTTQEVALETYTAFVRLKAAWQRVDAALSDYLQQGQPAPMSLTTLRAFSFEGQTSFAGAVRDFRRASQRRQQTVWEHTLWELLGYFVLQMASAGLVVGLLWRRWGAPAMWLRPRCISPSVRMPRACRTPSGANSTSGCASTSNACEKWRQFMRDLAMGRTPAPITPTDAADPLARSSQWLLRRLERERTPQERAS